VINGGKNYIWVANLIYNRLNKQNPNEVQYVLDELPTAKDNILTADVIALGGDILSFVIPGVGDVVSAGASSIGYGLSVSEYRKGNITKDQMMRIHISYYGGLIPGYGTAFDIYQTWIDFTGR
jgi:hypothetical protein